MTEPKDIFDKVKQRTGKTVPPEGRTPEMQEILEAMESIISTSPLTGLANKRGLDDRLTRELARIKGAAEHSGERRNLQERPTTFIGIDLDGFKHVNDTHGHEAGDAALRYFAKKLSGILRPTDLATHQGGDEFGAVVHTGGARARAIMDRLRTEMSADPFMHNGEAVPLSFSAGAHEIQASDQNIAAIKDIADKEAYEDKEGKFTRLAVEGVVSRLAGRTGQPLALRVRDSQKPSNDGPSAA
ncbi:MAG: GGDEF domain-containing protein [Alphaproteobacteria bacterium]